MYTPQRLVGPEFLANSITTYATVPAGAQVRISKAVARNTDTVPRSVSIYLAPTSAAATTEDLQVTRVLAAGESYELYQVEDQVLDAGMTIQAQASAADVVTLYISGVQITSG